MRWQKKLTKKEMKHLKENEIKTLVSLKHTREAQIRMKGEGMEPCWDCRFIAKKLGLEKEEGK